MRYLPIALQSDPRVNQANMTPSTSNFLLHWPAWLIAWLLSAGASILAHGPLPMYSTRTLSVAWEMWDKNQFLLPLLNTEPYSHKVPLLYWLMHAGWAVGGVGDVWPRILMVLIGAGVLAMAWRLALRLFPNQKSMPVVPWILAASSYFFMYSIQILFETLLMLWVLLAVFALARGHLSAQKPRWWLVGVAIGLGLLTKGPVMWLHLAFPLLLGPLWHQSAMQNKRAWYLGVGAAFSISLLMLLAWAIPAMQSGGAAYVNELIYKQTSGRMVQSFDHARAWWWYLGVLPLLLLPWVLWTPFWRGWKLSAFTQHASYRLLAIWFLPTLICFMLISGKQAYYLLPLLAPIAIYLAAKLGDEKNPLPKSKTQAWPLAITLIVLGALLLFSPHITWIESASHQLAALGRGHWAWGTALVAIGLFIAWPRRDNAISLVPIYACSAMLAAALLHGSFTQTLWPSYNIKPVAEKLAEAEQQKISVATSNIYEGQLHFLGRLTQKIQAMPRHDLDEWALANPNAWIIEDDEFLHREDSFQPLFSQTFRGRYIEIWRAQDWLQAEYLRTNTNQPAQKTE